MPLRTPSYRPGGLALVCLVATLASAPCLRADDPMPTILREATAPWSTVTLYTVRVDAEFDFLDALVLSGPYRGETPGFVAEKIVRGSLGAEDRTVTYLSINRHFDRTAMEWTEQERREAVAPYLAEEPFQLHGRMVEHVVASWGLERKSAVQTYRLAGADLRQELNQYGRTLTFFKTGYTGQLGSFQVFPPGTKLGEIRSQLGGARGLSGASIFQDPQTQTYAIYVEYFETPAERLQGKLRMPRGSGRGLPSGQMAGVVVQNYKAR